MPLLRRAALPTLLFLLTTMPAVSQSTPATFGPWNGSFISAGLGLQKPIKGALPPVLAHSPFTLYCWFRTDQPLAAPTFLAGLGTPSQPGSRYLVLSQGGLAFWSNQSNTTPAGSVFARAHWHLAAATYDGSAALKLYADGALIREASLTLPDAPATMVLAPESADPATPHFSGRIANFTLLAGVLSPAQIRALLPQAAALDLLQFEEGSRSWPVQTRAMVGQKVPQDPSTLPHSAAPATPPTPKPAYSGPVLVPQSPNTWLVAGGWYLAAAPQIHAAPAELSQPGFSTAAPWVAATIPGTVLTTYIDRGIYPDPDYGLNNLAIPETLNKQDYWYRTEFTPSPSTQGRQLTLTFHGINYHAEVWLNGTYLGAVSGAFLRGIFDVTHLLTPGKSNALAVRISPPPHPGIAQEESIAAGPGENGGMQCLDGPTFVATEGWDWIPSIRDRNAGIWQPVTLTATGPVSLGDPQVVTTLPLPDISTAQVAIHVPLHNAGAAPVSGTFQASFEGVTVTRAITLQPGNTEVSLTPETDATLRIAHPRLWWPNGYGNPDLYHLHLAFTPQNSAGPSDTKQLTFGIREVTYELSLVDPDGRLARVEYSPTEAHGAPVLDVRHEGALQTAQGWTYSILPGQANSPALRPDPDLRAAPFLILKVNGVRISVKGGSWGMDDSRKRVSRDRLEPFFRLHRDAHLTMIRNWVGQSTEEAFYDLADQYGLLVWNDFWESTQDYNLEPADASLFLANARDTILRFRNHPSVVLWCGRNEGMPSVTVNQGLDQLLRSLDGTRYYMPSSNQINLQNSGPYLHHEAADYFTTLSKGFAVEVGIPSIPTLEALQAFLPPSDRWPISDTWAYHDWHQSGNGRVAPFMDAVAAQFGPPASLEDFERKAQMVNYVNHRAIFEGMNAQLFAPNSGRMLWMTQPAWPSTNWQILSHDYDTQASFYGTMKACEPVHVQLNLPDLHAAVINNTAGPLAGLTIRARVFSLDARLLSSHEETLDAPANAAQNSFPVLDPATPGPVFVKLELLDRSGTLLSQNFYWYVADLQNYRQFNQLAPAALTALVHATQSAGELRLIIDLTNPGHSVALMNKLTLVDATTGARILPAYYSDNYVSLLPNETRQIILALPTSALPTTASQLQLNLRGWNATPASFPIPGH